MYYTYMYVEMMLVTQYAVVVVVTIILNCTIQYPGCIVVVVTVVALSCMYNT